MKFGGCVYNFGAVFGRFIVHRKSKTFQFRHSYCSSHCGCSNMKENRVPHLKFVKLSEAATAPTRGSKRAAGYDLYSAHSYEIEPKGKALVQTDIQIALPTGCYGRIAPRSGLTHKHFIDVGAGVIDEDYRGNVGVILFNFGDQVFKVSQGDRVAQLICERIFYPDIEEVQTLCETGRGGRGFGSSGNN